MDSGVLIKLANTKMPFGKYHNSFLMDLPLAYLLWFAREGFPKGELGQLMQLMLEINQNGTMSLLIPLKNDHCST